MLLASKKSAPDFIIFYNCLSNTVILWYVPGKALGADGQHTCNKAYGQLSFFIGLEKTQ